MILLDEYNFKGLSFSVIKVTSKSVIVRIKNSAETINSLCLEGSRYISKTKGILQFSELEPYELEQSGLSLLSDSFIDVNMIFSQGHLNEGDRIDLHINDIGNILILNNSGLWYVVEVSSTDDVEKGLTNRTQILDTLFEPLGITLQNVSYNISNHSDIHMFYELISNGNGKLEKSLYINMAFYNDSNKIIYTENSFLSSDDFIGFEVVDCSIDITDISKVAKILVYPSIA